MVAPKDTIRLAAMSDLHCRVTSAGALAPLFEQACEQADILLLCGDLTDFGKPEEAEVLAKELGAVRIPMIGVLGNHDYENNQVAEVRRILCDGGLHLLDGDVHEVHGIGFAGVKGFAGGFGRGLLRPWGEPLIKAFVHEAIEEALKLECALGSLRTNHRVALTHYAPIQGTIEGEPTEIFPYLGTERLEEALHRYPVDMVFHGHAHYGTAEGRTSRGIPVYNVALPLLQRTLAQPYRLVELSNVRQQALEATG